MKVFLFKKSCISIEKVDNQTKEKKAYTEDLSPLEKVYPNFKRRIEDIICILDLENVSQHGGRYEHWFKTKGM